MNPIVWSLACSTLCCWACSRSFSWRFRWRTWSCLCSRNNLLMPTSLSSSSVTRR
ncbi:hypothetical protein PF003_g18651 [Phytophthora fragariae]|nr:hypothetical protein PF003_g18651 [Phytophthora fragariae]